MNEIQIFSNAAFGEVRVAEVNGDPMFCLADVCKVLDLDPSQVVRRLGDGVVTIHPIQDSLGRTQQANFVNEDGLYDTILDSRKPDARAFRKWVTSDVLPSIRKHGRLPDPGESRRSVAESRYLDPHSYRPERGTGQTDSRGM